MLIMWRMFLYFLFVIASTSCRAESVERQFFKGDTLTRLERLETYSLKEQWQIFLYGNQVIHPPATGLALPIARRGKPALEYILQQLEKSENDLDFRDSLVVFRSMQGGGVYDFCSDETALLAIRAIDSKILDPDWRDIYNRILGRMCPVGGVVWLLFFFWCFFVLVFCLGCFFVFCFLLCF